MKSRHRSRTAAARSGCRTPEKEQCFTDLNSLYL
nr:MAG TPA: hypothetical protein [Bacteriophage sp.]